MKSIKTLLALALAASFASGSFAASEPATPLIKVPKTEEAMQATRAITARDTANDLVKPAGHKTKSGHAKSTSHKTKAGQTKGSAAKKHTTKAPHRAHGAK